MPFTLVRNGTLIDGLGGKPVPQAAILIEDDRIVAAGSLADINLPQEDVAELDAQRGYILPGLIDAHVHLFTERSDLAKRLNQAFSLNYYLAAERMQRTIEAGITTVRDGGGIDLGIKVAQERGLVVGPRLQISITILSQTGGHGDGWRVSGRTPKSEYPNPGRPPGVCDGIAEVRERVREVLRAGADVIKVCATGGVMSATDHPSHTQFSPEELGVVVREASYQGKAVMAHAQGTQGIKNAIRAGIQSIEHGVYLDDEAIQLMLENETFLVPTLLVPVALLEAAENSDQVPEAAIRKTREIIDIHRESAARAYKAGVRIAMGTDSGVGPHGQNLRELELLCEIGMTPMEALIAATKTAAECLGWADRLGTLQPGKLADIVISSTDPLAEISSLADKENIALVIQGGKIIVDRRSL